MSNTGEWYKVSRRAFAKVAAGSVALACIETTTGGKVAAMTQDPSTKPSPDKSAPDKTAPDQVAPATTRAVPDAISESRLAWLEKQIAQPITPELRAGIIEQMQGSDQLSQRGLRFKVPDGTEPAMVFMPLPRRSRQ